MTTQCIHGFPTQQCTSCRACEHGLMTTTCKACRTASTARRPAPAADADQPAHEHGGFEIFYEPSVSGWRYRGEDEGPSALSYRSAFLARKAVDELPVGASSATTPAPKRGAKRK